MKLKLRKAEKEEGLELLTLIKGVLNEYGLEINPKETDKDLSDLDSFYFNNRGWFSVLEVDGKIIGCYGLYHLHGNTCELRKMYLLNEYRGRGFGKLLMDDAIEKSLQLGYDEIWLETNKKLDRAIVLYRQYGFVEFEAPHLSGRCDSAMKKQL